MKPGSPRVRVAVTDWKGQTLLGKWTVERLIGVGGTSTVLQARHRNGRRAALKILHPHLAAHGRTRERFLREGRLANLVNHPGVVAVLDDFMTDDGTAVLVLELVHGQTLAALAKASDGLLEPREVVAAACAVLGILAVAHDANVIHRDIKPENILRCADGSHKLADFGLAALCHELGTLTGTNTTLGTPAYMSPEQARGDTLIDARTDIWGLGATMFTLLTGQFLHATSAPRNLVVAAATEHAPSALSIEPGMHRPLAEIIDRAVQMDKEQRWPNARAMLAALQALDIPAAEIRRVSSTSPTDGATMPTASSSQMSWSHAGSWLRQAKLRSKRQVIGTLFGVGIAVVVAVLVWLRLAGPPSAPASAANASTPPDAARATGRSAVVVPPSPDVPPSPRPAAATESRLEEPPQASHTLKARAHVQSMTTPKPSPNPTARAPVTPNADVSIPDEVLDRRE